MLREQALGPLDPYWLERDLRAMGSDAHLIVGDAEPALVDWAAAELERLERSWSRFRADSELSALLATPDRWVPVSAAMFDAFEKARLLWEVTGGLFDPTVRPALEAAGYDRSFEQVSPASDEHVAEPIAAPGFGLVELDPERSAIRVPAGVGIDLGGLGKGLAADRIAEGLVDRGARTALVALGGDIRVAGEPPPGGWRVPIEDPYADDVVLREHVLASGSLVTTTRRIRTWSRHGRRLHHLIDPRTGSPAASDVFAVVAAGPAAWWSEGIAKAALVAGSGEALELLGQARLTGTVHLLDGRTLVAGPSDGPEADLTRGVECLPR